MADDTVHLTEGAVRALVQSEGTPVNPGSTSCVVQVLRVIKVGGNQGQDRYRVILSDGQNFVQGMLATQLNQLVASGQIADNALIRVNDYMNNLVQNMHVIILLAVEVVNSQFGLKIGNPSDIEAVLSADPPAPLQPRPQSSPTQAVQVSESRPSPANATDDPSLRQVGTAIVEEMKCPISHELLVDPVTAEDGFQYEREEIVNYMKHVRENSLTLRSPRTNLAMGERLTDAIAVRNTIQRLIESGVIGGDVAEMYQMRSLVIETKKKVKNGDVRSMESLAGWYRHGENGLEKNLTLAQHWEDKAQVCVLRDRSADGDTEAMCILGAAYSIGKLGFIRNDANAVRCFEMAAKEMDPLGMACTGHFVAHGKGTTLDKVRGVSLVAASAAMKSDCGCYFLGKYYFDGKHALKVDLAQAKFWLERAIEIHGEGGFTILNEEQLEDAETMLCRMRLAADGARSNELHQKILQFIREHEGMACHWCLLFLSMFALLLCLITSFFISAMRTHFISLAFLTLKRQEHPTKASTLLRSLPPLSPVADAPSKK